jgi:hypothetical protein
MECGILASYLLTIGEGKRTYDKRRLQDCKYLYVVMSP